MSNIEVSIIVPVYNTEQYLNACIKSVLKQSYNNFELILINDGSIDNSEKICHNFCEEDERIRLVSQSNKGVSVARNVGIELSKGKYVMFLDSDDELLDDALLILINLIKEYNADLASGRRVYVGNKSENNKSIEIELFENKDALIQHLKYDRRFTGCHGKLFSREIIGQTRFYDGKKINEDMFFLFEVCIKEPKVVCSNENVYNYYVRDNSASTSFFSDKYLDMLYFCDLKMKYIMRNEPGLIELAKDMEISTHLFFLGVLCRTNDKQYKKDEKNSIRIVRKRYFDYFPINKYEKKMATIVMLGLYPVYKLYFNLKKKRNEILKCFLNGGLF